MGKAHLGGGPYEAETMALRDRIGAEGVVVIVKNGIHGDGFEVALDEGGLRALPHVLRALAAAVEAVSLCPKHGPFQPTQKGACPACRRGE